MCWMNDVFECFSKDTRIAVYKRQGLKSVFNNVFFEWGEGGKKQTNPEQTAQQ